MFYSFVFYALIGCVLSGISLSLFSPYVNLRKISYMGEALSHIAFAGIAIALVTGMNMQLVTMIFVMAIAISIGYLAQKFRLEEANAISIFLSVSMAFGILLISLKRSYTFDLASYLFGNVLLVDRVDVYQLAGLSLINLGFISFFYKELFYMTYNMEIAGVYRIKVKLVSYLFLLLLAVNIVVNLKIAGIILVTAQLVLPSAIAFNLSRNFKSAIVIGCIAALISALGGFYLSWVMNLPTGASIVCYQFLLFILSLFLKAKHT
ncbi:MAG: metal ABC transporter permease [Candidatus Cloacimonadaceae bacterium]|nr:metal ABC transporter permease [Candidatus Cloacimonadaceae bacterium]